MNGPLRVFAHLFVSSLLALPVAAVSADALPPPYAADFAPFSFTPPQADGFWSQGELGGRIVFARFDGDGRIVRTFPYGFTSRLSARADGGLSLGLLCEAQRIDANGLLSWRSEALPVAYGCDAPVTDAAGNAWLRGRCYGGCVGPSVAVRLDPHGVVRATWRFPDEQGAFAAAKIAGTRTSAGAWLPANGSLVRLDASATPVVAVNHALTTVLKRVVVDAQDRAWGFGVADADGPVTPRLQILLVTRDGSVVRRADAETLASPYIVASAANATGAVVLVADVTFSTGPFGEPLVDYRALRLHRFDAEGGSTWTRDLVPGTSCYYCTATLASNGDAILVADRVVPAPRFATGVQRFDAAGALLSDVEVEGAVSGPSEMPDGSLLAIATNAAFEPRFARWSRSGEPLPAPATSGAATGETELRAVRFERNGSATTLSTDPSEPRLLLAHHAADGAIAWRRDTVEPFLASAHLAGQPVFRSNARRTCWAGLQRSANLDPAALVLECVATATGATAFRRTVDVGASVTDFQLALAEDDSVFLAYRPLSPRDTRWVRFAASGDRVAERSFDASWDPEASNARGDILMTSPNRVALVGTDGEFRWNVFLGNDDDAVLAAVTADGGAALVVSQRFLQQIPERLVWLAPTGAERWRRNVTGYGGGATLALYGDDPVLYSGTSTVRNLRQVERFAAATGERRWIFPFSGRFGVREVRLATDTTTASIAVGSASDEQIRLTALDAETGVPRVDRAEACTSTYCQLLAMDLDTAGRVRFAERTGPIENRRPGGTRWRLRTVVAAPLRARVDQAGITGAWFPEYLPGQGVLAEWLPGSRTLFATWFTYARAANSPAELRWYSLQGEVPAGARSATLSIYENTNGRFAAPPATTAQRVGSATFRLDDCDHASLDYAFEDFEKSGLRGLLSLRRLTQPLGCTDESGPGTVPPPAAAGFDARQSGAWFSPTTSGQGLDISVTPGDSVFAAWFTYDPEGAADDAEAQHWLTLQGGLAGATGGRVVVPIYITIGGEFDKVPTRNTFRVGEATLAFTACDRATFEYRFDADEAAGTFAGRTGTLELQRLGGCTP